MITELNKSSYPLVTAWLFVESYNVYSFRFLYQNDQIEIKLGIFHSTGMSGTGQLLINIAAPPRSIGPAQPQTTKLHNDLPVEGSPAGESMTLL